MTTATHQQNGQRCGKEKGSHEIQKPPIVGTTVKSRCQTWFGCLAVTVRGVDDRSDLGADFGAGFSMRRTVVAPR